MGTGVIGKFVATQTKNFVVSQGKKVVVNKLTEKGKEVAGNMFFGQKVGAEEGLNGNFPLRTEENHFTQSLQDHRGYQMFADPKPTGLVKFFCGSSVIEADKLDNLIKEQRSAIYNEYNEEADLLLPIIDGSALLNNEGQVPEEGAPNQVQGGPDQVQGEPDQVQGEQDQVQRAPNQVVPQLNPMDVKPQKIVNKPITIDDFKRMVDLDSLDTNKEAKANKGYIRFVKSDGGKGVTLGKVGNKINAFMSWRVNVTPEHNRQMRLLFADSLFADWGGHLGPLADKGSYGTVLSGRMNLIRQSILNENRAGNMLDRKTVARAIKDFTDLFTIDKNKEAIVKSQMLKCLEECQYYTDEQFPGTDETKLNNFLKEFGSEFKLGGKTITCLTDVTDYVKDPKNNVNDAASMKKLLTDVANAFGKMNEVWQQERASKRFLNSITTRSASSNSLAHNEKQLGILKGALLRRLSTCENPSGLLDGTGFASWADLMNLYLDKAFPDYERAQRMIFAAADKRDKGMVQEAEDAFRNAFLIETIFKNIIGFAAWIKAENAKHQDADTPIGFMKMVLKKDYDALNDKIASLQSEGMHTDSKGMEIAGEKMLSISKDLKILDEIEKELSSDKLPPNLEDALKDKQIHDNKPNPRKFSKEELTDIIRQGEQSLTADLKTVWMTRRYLEETLNVGINELSTGENQLNAIQETMGKLRTSYENSLKVAMAVNVQSANDLSMNQVIEEFLRYLTVDVGVSRFSNENHIQTSNDPNANLRNTQITTKSQFIGAAMETLVKKAIDKKCQGKGDRAFAETLAKYKEQIKTISKMLVPFFEDVNKNGKIKGMDKFAEDVKRFEFKGALGKDGKVIAKNLASAYETRAKQLVNLHLLQSFFEEDVYPLLDSENPKQFQKELANKLNQRVDMILTEFRAQAIDEFYAGVLHFTMGTDDLNVLLDKDIHEVTKDIDTGYSDVNRVGQTFLTKFNEFSAGTLRNRIEDNKRPTFRPLNNSELMSKFKEQAGRFWRQDVVGNAPGKHFFGFVDKIINFFHNLLNVDIKNRQKDINPKWLENRAKTLGKKLDSFTKNYFSDEKALVDACRNEISAALSKSGDPRFLNCNSTERMALIEDVLDGYKDQIAEPLQNLLSNPDAKFDAKALAAKIIGSGGTEGVKEKFNRTIENRIDVIKARLPDATTLNKSIWEKLTANPDSKVRAMYNRSSERHLDTQVPTDLIKWVSDHFTQEALRHPVEYFRNDQNAFMDNLTSKAMAFIEKVEPHLEKATEGIRNYVYEDYNREIGKNEIDVKEFVGAEGVRLLDDFIFSYCECAFSEGVEKANDKVEKQTAAAKRSFDQSVQDAKTFKQNSYEKLHGAGMEALHEEGRKQETALIQSGMRPGLLEAFRNRITNDNRCAIENGEVKIGTSDYKINFDASILSERVTNNVKDFGQKLAATFEKNNLNFSKSSLTVLLEKMGVDATSCPDADAFGFALDLLMENAAFADSFMTIQKAAMMHLDDPAWDPKMVEKDWVKTMAESFKNAYAFRMTPELLGQKAEELATRLENYLEGKDVPKEIVQSLEAEVQRPVQDVAKILSEIGDVTFDKFVLVGNLGDKGRRTDFTKLDIDVDAVMRKVEALHNEKVKEAALAEKWAKWADGQGGAKESILTKLTANCPWYQTDNADPTLNQVANKNLAELKEAINSFMEGEVRSKPDDKEWEKVMTAIDGNNISVLGEKVQLKLNEAEKLYADTEKTLKQEKQVMEGVNVNIKKLTDGCTKLLNERVTATLKSLCPKSVLKSKLQQENFDKLKANVNDATKNEGAITLSRLVDAYLAKKLTALDPRVALQLKHWGENIEKKLNGKINEGIGNVHATWLVSANNDPNGVLMLTDKDQNDQVKKLVPEEKDISKELSKELGDLKLRDGKKEISLTTIITELLK